jgi:elongation factor Ts
MHVAASNPQYATVDAVPAEAVAKERALLVEQAKIENSKAEKPKPEDIVVKMVEGRLRKSLAEITLAGQPFVKDPAVTVEKLLAGAKAKVTAFERFEVGAGIEKKQEDFRAEVMKQVQGSGGGSATH